MDAPRLLRVTILLSALSSIGATHRTPNFVVSAPTPQIARQVAVTAERYRDELAMEWLGKKMPRWYRPCQVTVRVGQIGAGGATTFAFDRGEVFGWRMNVQGSLERILDSVLPHEVSHTVFACHFRRPLPRWADEGAATLAEHESEQRRQQLMFQQARNNRRLIPLKTLLSMKEYPRDMQNVLTLYAEGYSLADYLVQRGGKPRYLKFLHHAHSRGWDRALQKHYNFHTVAMLDKQWNQWVMAGSPRMNQSRGEQLAQADTSPPTPDAVVRSQSPDRRDERSETAANGKSPRRGTELEAPEPLSRAGLLHPVATRRRTSKDFTTERRRRSWQQARQRALSKGWVPLSPSRESENLDVTSRQQQSFSKSSSSQSSTPRSERPDRNSGASRAISFRERGQAVREDPDERSGRFTNWSDFPLSRKRDGSTPLGIASEKPISP